MTAWDTILLELWEHIRGLGIQKALLFLALLNGQWELVASIHHEHGPDDTFRYLRFPLSFLREGLQTAEEADVRSLLFPEAGEDHPLFWTLLDSALLLCLVLERGAAERVKEALKGFHLPREEVHRLWVEHNFSLALNRLVANIVSLLESIDTYTYEHSLRVAFLAERVALRLGFPKETRRFLEISGLIHDVGKLFVPREILLKPGKLTEEEFREVQRHVLELDRVFPGNEFMEPYVAVARLHHERLDGTGYLGLEGDAIPPESRILAACDVFDALIHDRPYRRAFSLEEAAAEMRTLAGSRKLDGEAVEALLAEVLERSLPSPANGNLPLVPGLPTTLKLVARGKNYPARVGGTRGDDRVFLILSEDVPCTSGEKVVLSLDLSFAVLEITARFLFREGRHYFFRLEGS